MGVEMWCAMQMALNTTAFPSTLTPSAPADFKITDTSDASIIYNPNAASRRSAYTLAALAAAVVGGALALVF